MITIYNARLESGKFQIAVLVKGEARNESSNGENSEVMLPQRGSI